MEDFSVYQDQDDYSRKPSIRDGKCMVVIDDTLPLPVLCGLPSPCHIHESEKREALNEDAIEGKLEGSEDHF